MTSTALEKSANQKTALDRVVENKELKQATESIAHLTSKIGNVLNIGGALDNLGSNLGFYKIQHKENDTKGLQPKKFTLPDNTQVDSLSIVVLAISFGRMKWPFPFDPTSKLPLCASKDGKRPTHGSHMEKMVTDCRMCKFSKWERTSSGDLPPSCSETYTLLCFDTVKKIPFLYSISRSATLALKEWKKLLASYSPTYGIVGIEPQFTIEFNLSITTDQNNTYVPKFTVKGGLDKTQAAYLMKVLLGNFQEFHGYEVGTGAFVDNNTVDTNYVPPEQQGYINQHHEHEPPPQSVTVGMVNSTLDENKGFDPSKVVDPSTLDEPPF